MVLSIGNMFYAMLMIYLLLATILTNFFLVFKLKDDKMEEPEMYLGADLSKMNNEDGDECWAMSSENIVQRW